MKTKSKGFTLIEVIIMVAIVGIIAAVLIPALGQMNDRPHTSPKQTQSQKAKEAAESISFTENAEIENIKNRLKLTSDPGLTGFVLLMNEAGQPIMYTGVSGKITSGSKRLTAPLTFWNKRTGKANGVDCTMYECAVLGSAASDEGTWGSSSPYIYFWTTDGQYIQWNGKYLYSDKPFRTKVEPLVISVK